MTKGLMDAAMQRAIVEDRRAVAEWMLAVLEQGLALGIGCPHFGKTDPAIKQRIRALRAKLGHPAPGGMPPLASSGEVDRG